MVPNFTAVTSTTLNCLKDLKVQYHRGSLLAAKPASGKGIKANQKPLGTGTLCSEEEDDDPVSADFPALHSTELDSREAN
ncbi:hypothetical protein BTVI_19650 [Pitangus sulphuratus]|nr:hypothetical protein BTVI_19650 [Pitangus sulphuratus]